MADHPAQQSPSSGSGAPGRSHTAASLPPRNQAHYIAGYGGGGRMMPLNTYGRSGQEEQTESFGGVSLHPSHSQGDWMACNSYYHQQQQEGRMSAPLAHGQIMSSKIYEQDQDRNGNGHANLSRLDYYQVDSGNVVDSQAAGNIGPLVLQRNGPRELSNIENRMTLSNTTHDVASYSSGPCYDRNSDRIQGQHMFQPSSFSTRTEPSGCPTVNMETYSAHLAESFNGQGGTWTVAPPPGYAHLEPQGHHQGYGGGRMLIDTYGGRRSQEQTAGYGVNRQPSNPQRNMVDQNSYHHGPKQEYPQQDEPNSDRKISALPTSEQKMSNSINGDDGGEGSQVRNIVPNVAHASMHGYSSIQAPPTESGSIQEKGESGQDHGEATGVATSSSVSSSESGPGTVKAHPLKRKHQGQESSVPSESTKARSGPTFFEDILVCPISHEIMKDPVILTQSGITYDREQLCLSLLHYPTKDPHTNQSYREPLKYIPNFSLRKILMKVRGDEAFVLYDDSHFAAKYNEAYKKSLESGDSGSAVTLSFFENVRLFANYGDVHAQYKLGKLYHFGRTIPQDYELARKWFLEAADQGHSDAEYSLGCIFAYGYGVPTNNRSAAKWWRRAAKQGHSNAQLNLGTFHYTGEGVTQNSKLAVDWWRKAAKQGNTKAQFCLGRSYDRGEGVAMNYKQAFRWWYKAAHDGEHTVAQYHLGRSYSQGKGVAKNQKKAKELWQKAAEQGHSGAQYELERCL